MRPRLIYAQTLHEPAVLLGCQASGFAFFSGPLETAGLQTFVKQNKSVTFPVQSLDPILPSAAKQKKRVGEGIQPELLFDKCGQAVNTKPEVCASAGDYDAVSTGEIFQHDFKTRSTASTIAASAPLWISASAPAIRTVTATPPASDGCSGVTSANCTSC